MADPAALAPSLAGASIPGLDKDQAAGGQETAGQNVDVDIDLMSPQFRTPSFRMFSYKVLECPRTVVHDWTECPYAHAGEKARRRDPRCYKYSNAACPDFRKGTCKRGDFCPYAHGVFESWLHPSRYCTHLCKDGALCTRKVCFFAHNLQELRNPADAETMAMAAASSSPASVLSSEDSASSARSLFGGGPQSAVKPAAPHAAAAKPAAPSDALLQEGQTPLNNTKLANAVAALANLLGRLHVDASKGANPGADASAEVSTPVAAGTSGSRPTSAPTSAPHHHAGPGNREQQLPSLMTMSAPASSAWLYGSPPVLQSTLSPAATSTPDAFASISASPSTPPYSPAVSPPPAAKLLAQKAQEQHQAAAVLSARQQVQQQQVQRMLAQQQVQAALSNSAAAMQLDLALQQAAAAAGLGWQQQQHLSAAAAASPAQLLMALQASSAAAAAAAPPSPSLLAQQVMQPSLQQMQAAGPAASAGQAASAAAAASALFGSNPAAASALFANNPAALQAAAAAVAAAAGGSFVPGGGVDTSNLAALRRQWGDAELVAACASALLAQLPVAAAGAPQPWQSSSGDVTAQQQHALR